MEINILVSVRSVLDEVAQKAGYTAVKRVPDPNMEGDDGAYDRVTTVDEDEAELMQFFGECRSWLALEFSDMLVKEGMDAENEDSYGLMLNVNDGFNIALLPSLQLSLFNFFVYGILYRWFMYTRKEESDGYAALSASMFDGIKKYTLRRTYERKTRPF